MDELQRSFDRIQIQLPFNHLDIIWTIICFFTKENKHQTFLAQDLSWLVLNSSCRSSPSIVTLPLNRDSNFKYLGFYVDETVYFWRYTHAFVYRKGVEMKLGVFHYLKTCYTFPVRRSLALYLIFP